MGLFDVFKKNNKEEHSSEFKEMERRDDAPSAQEVREAVAAPAQQAQVWQPYSHEAPVRQPYSQQAQAQSGNPAQQSYSQQAQAQSGNPAQQSYSQQAQAQSGNPAQQKMVSLPAITPNKLMSVSNPDIIAREDQARVLAYFIERYSAEKTPANLQSCIKTFTDTWLWVPMRMQFSAADAAGLKAQTADKKYVPKNPVRLVPELLRNQNGDILYFSFTSRDEITDEFMQKYVWMQMPSVHCAIFALKHPEVTAIVINPFTKNLGLKRDLITKIVKKKGPEENSAQRV